MPDSHVSDDGLEESSECSSMCKLVPGKDAARASSGGLQHLIDVLHDTPNDSAEPGHPERSECTVVPADQGNCGEQPKIKRRRRRVLSCPICKSLHRDATSVPDGEACRRGHIIINNLSKTWKCVQVE